MAKATRQPSTKKAVNKFQNKTYIFELDKKPNTQMLNEELTQDCLMTIARVVDICSTMSKSATPTPQSAAFKHVKHVQYKGSWIEIIFYDEAKKKPSAISQVLSYVHNRVLYSDKTYKWGAIVGAGSKDVEPRCVLGAGSVRHQIGGKTVYGDGLTRPLHLTVRIK